MEQITIDFDEITRPAPAMKAFIEMALRKEGRGNLFFRLCWLFLSNKYAIRLYFKKIFKGCDHPTFLHFCNLFCRDYLPKLIRPEIEEEIRRQSRKEVSICIHFNGPAGVINPYLLQAGIKNATCTYLAEVNQMNILTGNLLQA